MIRNFLFNCNLTCNPQDIGINELTKKVYFINVVFNNLTNFKFIFQNLEEFYLENATIQTDLENTTLFKLKNI